MATVGMQRTKQPLLAYPLETLQSFINSHIDSFIHAYISIIDYGYVGRSLCIFFFFNILHFLTKFFFN